MEEKRAFHSYLCQTVVKLSREREGMRGKIAGYKLQLASEEEGEIHPRKVKYVSQPIRVHPSSWSPCMTPCSWGTGYMLRGCLARSKKMFAFPQGLTTRVRVGKRHFGIYQALLLRSWGLFSSSNPIYCSALVSLYPHLKSRSNFPSGPIYVRHISPKGKREGDAGRRRYAYFFSLSNERTFS